MSTSLPPRVRRDGNSHAPPPAIDFEADNEAPINDVVPVDSFSAWAQSVLDQYVIHPLADTVGLHPEHELWGIADDIAVSGQRLPIVFDQDGRIIDGRNRLVACGLVGVEPYFEQMTFATDKEVADYIRSVNVATGNRSVSQKVMQDVLLYFDTDVDWVGANSLRRKELPDILSGNPDTRNGTRRDGVRVRDAKILAHARGNPDERLRGEATKLVGAVKNNSLSIEDAFKAWQEACMQDSEYAEKMRLLNERAPDLAERVHLHKLKYEAAHRLREEREKATRQSIDAGKRASRNGLADFASNVSTILTALATVNEGIGCYPNDTPESVLPSPDVMKHAQETMNCLVEAYNRVHGE